MRAHLVAAAAVAGAWWSDSIPVAVVMLVMVGAVRWRRSTAVVVGAVVVIASARGAHSEAALSPPPAGPFDEWVELVDDPRSAGPVGVIVTVRAGNRLLTASGHGPVAGRLDDGLAGERMRLVGTVRPVRAGDTSAKWRHVVGRITVERVAARAAGSPVAGVANGLRRTLGDGAQALPRDDRAVFLGMVIGDDRGQSPVVADDFRAGGLGHLLVVSGQNVAFVLAVAAPVIGRWRPAGRLVGVAVVLGLFAVLTRFEPSVLRAVAMAGAGVGAAVFGRPLDGRRALSWAVAVLVVVDPFLVHRVAFQLSVAATAGIVWWSGALRDLIPGPPWLAVPAATTVAAQLGVAPFLLAVFGPMPLAALPANLLAGPVSGAVMVWGCTAGLVAGAAGGGVAAVLHLPTKAMIWWITEVAAGAARGPQATLGGPGMLGSGAAIVLALKGGPRSRLVGGGLVAVVVAVALATVPHPAPGRNPLGYGATLWVDGEASALVLDDPGDPQRVLEVVRRRGAGPPDLVVVLDGDRADADAVIALRDRYGPVPVAAPPLHRVPGGRTVERGQRIDLGGLVVQIREVAPRIAVIVTR